MKIYNFKSYMEVLRINNNESLRQMAKRLQISATFLSAIENNKKKIPTNFLNKICSIYNLNRKDNFLLKNLIILNNIQIELNDINIFNDFIYFILNYYKK